MRMAFIGFLYTIAALTYLYQAAVAIRQWASNCGPSSRCVCSPQSEGFPQGGRPPIHPPTVSVPRGVPKAKAASTWRPLAAAARAAPALWTTDARCAWDEFGEQFFVHLTHMTSLPSSYQSLGGLVGLKKQPPTRQLCFFEEGSSTKQFSFYS